jgi:hypothetical protein
MAGLTLVCLALGFAVGYGVNKGPAAPAQTTAYVPGVGTITAPPGAVIEVEASADPGTEAWYREQRSGQAANAGMTASGQNKLTQAGEWSAPIVNLGKMIGSGGSGEMTVKALGSGGQLTIIIFGCLFIVGGIVVAVVFKAWTWAVALVASGLAVVGIGVAMQTAPWVLWLIPLVLLIVCGIGGYMIYRGKVATKGLTAVAKSVETQDTAAKTLGKTDSIAKAIKTATAKALGGTETAASKLVKKLAT